MPLIPYLIGGVLVGWIVKETGDLTDSTAKLAKVLVAGGVVYVAYRAVTK